MEPNRAEQHRGQTRPAVRLPGSQQSSPNEWASQERAYYTKLFRGLPKIKTIKGNSFSQDKTEDVLGIPILVDRTIQICEDVILGCVTSEIGTQAFERLVKSARTYSVPWNLVGHVLDSATETFPENAELGKLRSWAGRMNRLGSL